MQGIESLDNFKSFVSSLGGLGRFEDTYIVHAAEGETVVPMEVLDRNPALKKRLFRTMVDMGIEPGRYIVGNELNSRNPVTGQPEFFLKKIVSQIRKALPGNTEQFLGPLVGLATGNPLFGAIAGGIGSGVPGAIGGGITGLRSPGLNLFQSGKEGFVAPLKLKDLADADRLREIFLGGTGEGGETLKGIFGSGGSFDLFGKKTDPLEKAEKVSKIVQEANVPDEFKGELFKTLMEAKDQKTALEIAEQYALPFFTLAELFKSGEQDGDVGISQYNRPRSYEEFEGGVFEAAEGGITDLRTGGMSLGPGTETSDDIPAMLSDGEFVMTAKAVRGAGGGDRREGAKKMYETMDRLEAQA